MQPMYSLPHPNQVRSACERCRKQKAKCSRSSALSPSCARCDELGLACQPGTQRRVGRPVRREKATREHTTATATATASEADASLLPPSEGGPYQEGDSPRRELPEGNHPEEFLDFMMDWVLPDDSGPPLYGAGHQGHSLSHPSAGGTSIPSTEPTDSPLPSPCTQYPAMIRITADNHFSTLSRINKELHSLSEKMSYQLDPGTLEPFIKILLEPAGSAALTAPYQYLMRLSQDYLQVIKSLHMSLGTHSRIAPSAQSETTKQTGLAMACIDPSLTPSPNGSVPNAPPPILDSPTALLVISCFSQLLQHLETFFIVSYARLDDTSCGVIAPANEAFAGIRILEFLTQAAMFVEMIRNVFSQIIVVLGLPTDPWWSGKSRWTGLLAETRYRDMLNRELGSVVDGWSTRPSKLIELIDSCKMMITDLSMLGIC